MYDAKLFGAVAHLGERIPCTDEVAGSIPVRSTNLIYLKNVKKMSLVEFWGGVDSPETKKCIKCGEYKTLNNFGYRSYGKTGNKREQRNDCYSCIKKQVKIAKELKKQYPFPEDPNYICPICERTESEIKSNGSFHEKQGKKTIWRIDHNHITGEYRGWICDYCNNGLSRFNDNPTVLRNAANYIENYIPR